MADDCRRRFEEEQRLCGHGVAQFRRVLPVVAADAYDLRGFDGGEQSRLFETHDRLRPFDGEILIRKLAEERTDRAILDHAEARALCLRV